MSEQQTAEATATGTEATTEPSAETKPTETVEFWKAKAREQEKRAKENVDAAKRLREIEDAQKSEAEKAAERMAHAEERAASAEARAVRRDIAIEHKLNSEDAALLDSLNDESAIRRLAERLANASEDTRNKNNVSPREGNNPTPKSDKKRDFLRSLTGGD